MHKPPAQLVETSPFAGLPVKMVTAGAASHVVAVHVSGRFGGGRMPLVCLAGFHRNMSDFADFMGAFRQHAMADWPFALIDLPGRGRSARGGSVAAYSTPDEAHDVNVVLSALGVNPAILLGQGHGGQVIMALAGARPGLVGAAILIDAGPVTDPRGLVRLRNNLRFIEASRGADEVRQALRRGLAADYPKLPEAALDRLAARTHAIDERGKARELFDPALVKLLEAFDPDDVLEPQWPLFDALAHAPLMLARTERTDLLRPETFEAMRARRPDATCITIPDQGSPALLDGEEAGAIAAFVAEIQKRRVRWFRT